MMATYSPHREESGPVHLRSPKHIGPFDPHSAIREIRRSLSRSPSKGSEFRQYPFRSPCGNTAPYNPSLLSPSRRSTSENLLQTSAMAFTHAGRNQPGPRIQRPTLRRTAQSQGAMRLRTSPKSPSKRVLTDLGDSANSSPMTLRKRSSTETADRELTPKGDLVCEDKENPQHYQLTDDVLGWKSVQHTRQEKRRSGGALITTVAPLSPMKRADGPMTVDQPDFDSHSAKRRSLHGPGLDFSIFESDPLEPNDHRSQDDNDWFRHHTPLPSSRFSTIPKRSSSLRKSTIQQRQADRPSHLKVNNQIADAIDKSWLEATPTTNKKAFRLSLDNHLAPLPRESPFSSQGTLLNASIHPVGSTQHASSQPPSRHPLSRTLTQSSSTTSMPDDSPTHEPIHRSDRPRSHDFSKSLPIGASRPSPSVGSTERSSQGSFATPGNYKFAKPLPAAFMSTGLISKKNRNAEEPNAGLPKAHMPDTPCKKQAVIFPTDEKYVPANPALNRTSRQSFDLPLTSVGMNQDSQVSAFPFAKSVGIFGPRPSKHSLVRKASFASIEGDDKAASQSPGARGDSQSTDTDYPPTPTKHYTELPHRKPSASPSSHHSQVLPLTHGRSTSVYAPRFTSISPRPDKVDRTSPHTPQESFFPPDPSGLSISGRAERATLGPASGHSQIIPATPTGPREYFPNFSNRPSLNLALADVSDVDRSLTSRFQKVDLVGTGEFSQVYRVSQPPETSPYHKIYSVSTSHPCSSTSSLPGRVWAVKKSRYPYSGAKDRQRKIREVDVLKSLGHSDHILGFVDSWEEGGHLYIQTEFCEEGTLDVFLAQVGLKARLDDFRIWKILLELSLGLKHIHDSGFIHLDLKPANILITFEGVLKIADFGMATRWPAKAGIDGEGDREYIGPEVLMGKYDKPADIFALGLIMLETAGNVELPDNGVSWQKLRNGDMSDVPSLTWSSDNNILFRDSSGNPLLDDDENRHTDDDDVDISHPDDQLDHDRPHRESLHLPRSGELIQPPPFMIDPAHEQALDRVVRWMISPAPADRPVASQVLATEGVKWAESRRRAGATVFEGNWGPADEVLAEDAEMIDV